MLDYPWLPAASRPYIPTALSRLALSRCAGVFAANVRPHATTSHHCLVLFALFLFFAKPPVRNSMRPEIRHERVAVTFPPPMTSAGHRGPLIKYRNASSIARGYLEADPEVPEYGTVSAQGPWDSKGYANSCICKLSCQQQSNAQVSRLKGTTRSPRLDPVTQINGSFKPHFLWSRG